MKQRVAPGRSGMSLLEVLVALAIFLGALIVLGKLVILGGERAQETRDLARATELCQSKLAEIAAGAVPLTSQSGTPFDEDADWQWSLDCSQGDIANLWDVTVRVHRQRNDGSEVECVLSQKMLDPSIRGNATDGALAAAANAANNSSNNSSGSTTPSTQSGASPGTGGGGQTKTGPTNPGGN